MTKKFRAIHELDAVLQWNNFYKTVNHFIKESYCICLWVARIWRSL